MTKTFAEKPLTKVVLLFYVVLTIFCAASCSAGASGKLKQISSDVDYDFVIFNRDNLVINGVHYDINELARKISGKKNRNYIKFSVLIGDFLYYSYEYGSRRGIFGNGDDNTFKEDVALFKTNLKTAETKLLYDFKKAVPRGRYSSDTDICRYADDKTFVFVYNGDLLVFDLETESVTQTLQFYDKDVFKNLKYKNVYRNEYGDYYYMLGDGVLRYAEYRDGKLIDHSFTVDEKSGYVKRFGDYVYTSRYIKDLTYDYYNCYNLKTEEATDRDALLDIVKQHEEQIRKNLEQEKEEEEREKDEKEYFTVGDKTYYCERDDNYGYNRGRIIIKNENDETLYEIDGEYAAANNPKYSGLFNAYRENCDGTGAYVGAETYKNRLFISFSYDFGLYGGHTADMIFEFNPENGNLSYVTYIYGGCRFFSITEKSDSDNLGDLGNPDNSGETAPA